jgi:hypothetical protein
MNNDGQIALTLGQCLRFFVHYDESNAAVHGMPVRFSPITFRIAEALQELEQRQGFGAWPININDHLALVLEHKGTYTEDPGR